MTKSYDTGKKCQVNYKSFSIILGLLSIDIEKVVNQRDIAKKISMDFQEFNTRLNTLQRSKLVISKSAGQGRIKKHYVDIDKIHFSDFQNKILKNSLDIDNNIRLSLINNKKDIINKYLSKNNLKKENLKNYNHYISKGKLRFKVGEKEYTEKQFTDTFILDKKKPNGERNYIGIRPKKLTAYRNEVTGLIIFNLDFGKIKKISQDHINYAKHLLTVTKDTILDNLTKSNIIWLFKKYPPKVVFTKVFYILDGINSKIANPYRYLSAVCENVINGNDDYFVELKTESGEKFSIPRLCKAVINTFNFKDRYFDLKDMFNRIWSKITDDGTFPNFWKIWSDKNIVFGGFERY